MTERYREGVHYTVTENGCWVWLLARSRGGYGTTRFQRRWMNAHRALWLSRGRELPDRLNLDHLCRHRACVNPDHMEPVTGRENTLRGMSPPAANARRTACKHGHPLQGSNLYVRPDGKGRHCIRCKRERNKVFMRTRAAATKGN